MNSGLLASFTAEEVIAAFRDINPPNPLGSTASLVVSFVNTGIFWEKTLSPFVLTYFVDTLDMASVNETVIVLIPKVDKPTSMRQLRPIVCPAAFVQGRAITDNILVAHELVHTLHTSVSRSSQGAVFKLDMEKAFDRVEWPFLKAVMLRLGFAPSWVDLIMRCVSSVSSRVRVRGALSEAIRPQRGLRQGDPLSPFLFLFCSEGLSAALTAAQQEGHLPGSALKVNFSKSTAYFSPRTPPAHRTAVHDALGVQEVDDPGIYLGVPLLIASKHCPQYVMSCYLLLAFWLRRCPAPAAGFGGRVKARPVGGPLWLGMMICLPKAAGGIGLKTSTCLTLPLWGGNRKPHHQLTDFASVLLRNDLADCKPSRGWFTWMKSGSRTMPIRERLDRFIADSAWFLTFPTFRAWSEYSPKLRSSLYPSRYCSPASATELVGRILSFVSMTVGPGSLTVSPWSNLFGPILRSFVESSGSLLAQRSRVLWLSAGDQNTSFFHAKASARKKKNAIVGLYDCNGYWQTSTTEVLRVASDYFVSLFSANPPVDAPAFLEHISPSVTADMNSGLLASFTAEEVIAAFRDINPRKSPGIDGLPSGFFRQHWDILGEDFVSFVLTYFVDTLIWLRSMKLS
ncbi:hypothetical protein GQ457_16G019010 [Hibiscus cannabinus]